jgi:hypothetical protein
MNRKYKMYNKEIMYLTSFSSTNSTWLEARVTTTRQQRKAIGGAAEYNWFNLQDSLIYSGTNMTVTLDTTTKFKLEVLALADGFKDYDEVTINVKQYEITNIAPNPTNGQVTVEYDVEGVSSAYLLITKPYNPITYLIVLDLMQNQKTFDLSDYAAGIYGVILVCDDQMVDQKLLYIQ